MAFGPKIVKRTKIKESKNGNPYNYCYVEIGNKLYKVTISNCQKDSDRDNAGDYWVSVELKGGVNGGGNRGGRSYGQMGGQIGPALPQNYRRNSL